MANKQEIIDSLNESVPFCPMNSCINNFEDMCLYNAIEKRELERIYITPTYFECSAYEKGIHPLYLESESEWIETIPNLRFKI